MAIINNLATRARQLDNNAFSTIFRLKAHPTYAHEITKVHARKQAGREPEVYLETHPDKQYNQLPIQPAQLRAHAQKKGFSVNKLEKHINETLSQQTKHHKKWAADVREASKNYKRTNQETLTQLTENLTERLIAYRILHEFSNQQPTSDEHKKRIKQSFSGLMNTSNLLTQLNNPYINYEKPVIMHLPKHPYLQLAKKAI